MRTARDGFKMLFSAVFFSQAVADDGPSCTVAVTPDARMPSRVQSVFKTAGSAIMACRVCPQGVSFSELSPVVSNPDGVCRFTARRLDDSIAGGDRDGRQHTGTQFMLLAEHGCPDQRDTRYVPTYETSPKDFRAACSIWRRMTGSDANVAKRLNQLRNSAHLRLAADEGIRLREAARPDTLRLLNVSGVSKGDNSVPGADHKLLVRAENAKETQFVVYVVTRRGHESIAGIALAVR